MKKEYKLIGILAFLFILIFTFQNTAIFQIAQIGVIGVLFYFLILNNESYDTEVDYDEIEN
ncbi:hypothetical protein M2325_000660 [Methanococcus voltae PS]|uniref:Uncharacterized protein n=1 Tax=Methanococcus voltae PS TaxID=523842 RepID=A0ABT2EVV3_METVO|nr:hypothetical protein [Methanococcus voltae]MCS3921975.1 hypothetical protein [Methanococcus voltae PS]